MAEILGFDCATYYNTASTASPTLVKLAEAGTVEVSLDRNAVEVASRGLDHVAVVPGMMTSEVSVEYIYQRETVVNNELEDHDLAMDFMITQFFDKSVVEYFFLDGTLADTSAPIQIEGGSSGADRGISGFRSYMSVTSMPVSQPLDDVLKINFTLRHSRHRELGVLVEPSWYIVPSS